MERVCDLSWGSVGGFVLQPNAVEAHTGFEPALPSSVTTTQSLLSRDFKAHTGFEPVLPPNAGTKPDSGSRGQVAPGSELNPHLRAVLERLKQRDRERER